MLNLTLKTIRQSGATRKFLPLTRTIAFKAAHPSSSRVLSAQRPLPSLLECRKFSQAPSLFSPKAQDGGVYIPTGDDDRIQIRAYHLASSIDLPSLTSEGYKDHPTLARETKENNVVIAVSSKKGVPGTNTSKLPKQLLAAYEYGSVVFFGFTEVEEQEHLKRISKFCVAPHEDVKREEYNIVLEPNLQEFSSVKSNSDYMSLQKLEPRGVQVIGGVMAQSVALNHYERLVDDMMSQFVQILNESKGKKASIQREHLFRIIAQSNQIKTDILRKLNLLDRSEIPWKYPVYHQIWNSIRDEFELVQRFTSVELKTEHIKQNTKFFIDISGQSIMEKLERMIIYLITIEIGLSLLDLGLDALAEHEKQK